MGATNSKNNDEMVDALVNNGSIKDKQIEQVFRLVDRGRFFPPEHLADAYREQPFKIPDSSAEWTPGRLHISAPSMYAAVMDNLQLRPGMSFLNIGSGTGWLSTAVGFLIGSEGVNHGIEIHENLYKYSIKRLYETLETPELASFSFAVPRFVHGNGLSQKIPDGMPRYDRIYCGAALSSRKNVDRLVRMLEIRGRLIAPVNGGLMCYHRTGVTRYTAQRLMACQFADLIRSSKTDRSDILPIIQKPETLQRLCRNYIRNKIREELWGKIPPKMRSKCSSKERNDTVVNGPHVIYVQNVEQQGGEGRLNIMNGPAPANLGNFARVRVVIPNAEDPHWHDQDDIILHQDNEDNTRLQVYDLKDEEDDDEEEQRAPVPVRDRPQMVRNVRRLRQPGFNQLEEAVLLMDPQLHQMLERHGARRVEHLPEDEGPAEQPFPDEGPNVVESDDEPDVAQEEQEAESSSSDEEENEANEEPMQDDPDNDIDREIDQVLRPRRPEPPELPEDLELRELNERIREHRRVSRQRMQVMINRRRIRTVETDTSDDEELVQESREQYKRRRTEESKDERQVRLQKETINHFREIFNLRIDTLPVPKHINEYLKHSNGRT